MFGASPFAFLQKKKAKKQEEEKPIIHQLQPMSYQSSTTTNNMFAMNNNLFGANNYYGKKQEQEDIDLNVYIVKFQGMNQAQKNLAGGDPFQCKKCKAILNKYSKVLSNKQFAEQKNLMGMQIELKPHQSLWVCQFCTYPNIISIQLEQIPKTDDIFYMLQSQHEKFATQNDSTLVFCVDTSGSMNTTSEVQGKMNLKFGLSEEEITMLKSFMQPGDQAQFNFLPGNQNKNKTFISRKQCVLSAIQSHLQELKKSDPFKRVGFVTFNNQITVLGDSKANTINIVGDKIDKKEAILNDLKDFKLSQPIAQSFNGLIDNLNKTQAKGQTALGPALITAIEVASKGSPGSVVTLCTDGLANRGLGSLDPLTEQSKVFYKELATLAKQRNIAINIITIKGEGCKMEVIGELAQITNGNLKVVNPEKLSEDFANIMKDEIVGLNINIKIMLHKAMSFRNEQEENLKENKTILEKHFANATAQTKISFQYELRPDQELQAMKFDVDKLKTIPFQAQIVFTSAKGGKFLRVLSSESKTTMQKEQIKKQVNLPVVHHRVAQRTAQLYEKGNIQETRAVNRGWANYLNNNFQSYEHQNEQKAFMAQNVRLNQALSNKYYKKKQQKRKKQKAKGQKQDSQSDEQKYQKKRVRSKSNDSDQDEMQYRQYKMGKGGYNIKK